MYRVGRTIWVLLRERWGEVSGRRGKGIALVASWVVCCDDVTSFRFLDMLAV